MHQFLLVLKTYWTYGWLKTCIKIFKLIVYFKIYVSYLLVMIMLNVNENIMERGSKYAHVHYKNSM